MDSTRMKLTEKQARKASAMVKRGSTTGEVASALGVSVATLYRYRERYGLWERRRPGATRAARAKSVRKNSRVKS